MNCIDTMGPPQGDLVISNHSTLWIESGSTGTPQWKPLHTILDDNAYRVKVPSGRGQLPIWETRPSRAVKSRHRSLRGLICRHWVPREIAVFPLRSGHDRMKSNLSATATSAPGRLPFAEPQARYVQRSDLNSAGPLSQAAHHDLFELKISDTKNI